MSIQRKEVWNLRLCRRFDERSASVFNPCQKEAKR
jgi:hypothetical protein